jgi:hypothetical protein
VRTGATVRAALLAAGVTLLSACGSETTTDGGPPPPPPAVAPAPAPDAEAAPTVADRPVGLALTGRVRFLGSAPERRPALVVKDRDCCGSPAPLDERLVVSATGGVRDAVLELRGVKGETAKTLSGPFELTQTKCVYEPHVLVVPCNTPVLVHNADPVLHNVHSFCKRNAPANLAQPGGSDAVELTFEAAERVQLRCDLHGWMHAWVIVVDHPWYARTDAEGNFSLDGVPPGTYTLRCWQETLGERELQVTVAANAGPVEIAYPADALPGSGR